jgi:hypothetical protein
MKTTVLAIFAILLSASPSLATNAPCSGSKGGVSHCDGRRFVCKDGSISRSRRDCSTTK